MDNSKEYVQRFSEVALSYLSAIERSLLETMMRNAYLDGKIDMQQELFLSDDEDEDGAGRDGLPIQKKEIPNSIKNFIESLPEGNND